MLLSIIQKVGQSQVLHDYLRIHSTVENYEFLPLPSQARLGQFVASHEVSLPP